MSPKGHSRQGRAASKPGYVRYAAESGSKFRAASQLIWRTGLAPRRSPPRRVSGRGWPVVVPSASFRTS